MAKRVTPKPPPTEDEKIAQRLRNAIGALEPLDGRIALIFYDISESFAANLAQIYCDHLNGARPDRASSASRLADQAHFFGGGRAFHPLLVHSGQLDRMAAVMTRENFAPSTAERKEPSP